MAIRINPQSTTLSETHTGPVRINMEGPKGNLILTLEIDDEGFPVVDIHFPNNRGEYFTVNANEQDDYKRIPDGKDLTVTLGGSPEEIKARLEELRAALNAENISYGELHELQSLAPYIEPHDVQLLEAAGVPEFPE